MEIDANALQELPAEEESASTCWLTDGKHLCPVTCTITSNPD